MIAGDKEDDSIKKLLTVNALLVVLLLIFAACDSGSSGGDTSGGATNPPPTSSPGLDDFESTMLGHLNDARDVGRDCGNTFYPAAPPLNWDNRLEASAQGHSEDMADNQHFSHEGTDGTDPGDRIMNEGYDPSAWGETILVGIENRSKVVDAFLDSPEHCSIIMDPTYEDVGAGYASGNYKGNSTLYWTIDFATEKN